MIISPGTPSLLERVSTDADGFFGFLDVSYQFVFKKTPRSETYWSLGAALSHYDFDILFNGQTESQPSSQTDFGFSAGFGYAYNFNEFLLRVEGRYIRTNEGQLAGLLSVQRYF